MQTKAGNPLPRPPPLCKYQLDHPRDVTAEKKDGVRVENSCSVLELICIMLRKSIAKVE